MKMDHVETFETVLAVEVPEIKEITENDETCMETGEKLENPEKPENPENGDKENLEEATGETDGGNRENKPEAPKIHVTDSKTLTARQTRLLSFLNSENPDPVQYSFQFNLQALNEIANNLLTGDNVSTIQEADILKNVSHKKKNHSSFGSRASLKGYTFVGQKIKTLPGKTNVESIEKVVNEEKAEKQRAHEEKHRKLKSDNFKVKKAIDHEINMAELLGTPKTKAEKRAAGLKKHADEVAQAKLEKEKRKADVKKSWADKKSSDKKVDEKVDKKVDKKVDEKVEKKVVKTITTYIGGVKQVTTVEEVAETGDFSLSAPPKVNKFEAAKKQVAKKKDAILSKKKEEENKKKAMSTKKWMNSTNKNSQNKPGNKRKISPDSVFRSSENTPYYGDAVTASVNHNQQQQQQPQYLNSLYKEINFPYGKQPQSFPQQNFSQNMNRNMQSNVQLQMQQTHQHMQNAPQQSWNQFNPPAQQQPRSWSSQCMNTPQPIQQQPVLSTGYQQVQNQQQWGAQQRPNPAQQYQAPSSAVVQNQWASAGYANGNNAGWSKLPENNAPPQAKTSRKSWAGW